jgi:hypothetical protein
MLGLFSFSAAAVAMKDNEKPFFRDRSLKFACIAPMDLHVVLSEYCSGNRNSCAHEVKESLSISFVKGREEPPLFVFH